MRSSTMKIRATINSRIAFRIAEASLAVKINNVTPQIDDISGIVFIIHERTPYLNSDSENHN